MNGTEKIRIYCWLPRLHYYSKCPILTSAACNNKTVFVFYMHVQQNNVKCRQCGLIATAVLSQLFPSGSDTAGDYCQMETIQLFNDYFFVWVLKRFMFHWVSDMTEQCKGKWVGMFTHFYGDSHVVGVMGGNMAVCMQKIGIFIHFWSECYVEVTRFMTQFVYQFRCFIWVAIQIV
jgi:hypothetical protein